jgi:hypothetical protein
MRRLGSAACLTGLLTLAGGSVYGWQMSPTPAAAAPARTVAFSPCLAERTDSAPLAARQAIRAFLGDQRIDRRYRTAAVIGVATWTGHYVAEIEAYSIDLAIPDPTARDARHYGYLVNLTGCTAEDRDTASGA